MRACLLILSVLSSLIPLSGRESALDPMSGNYGEAYRLRLPREAPSSIPRKLKVVQQPRNASRGLPFRIQPQVQLLDEEDQHITGIPSYGAPWEVVASGSSMIPSLSGTTRVAADKDGLATFTDLTLGSPVSQYSLIFRVDTDIESISLRSNEFSVEPSPYSLETSSVTVHYLNHDTQQVSLDTQLIITDIFTRERVDLKGKKWYYKVSLRYQSPKLKLSGPISGTFDTTPFKLKNVLLTGWVYQQQLLIDVWPSNSPTIVVKTERFNVVPPQPSATKKSSKRHVLSIQVNVSQDLASQVDPHDAEWAFLNEFGVMNGSQLWENCNLHATQEPTVEWEINGKSNDVAQTATALYNRLKHDSTFRFVDQTTRAMQTWALVPKTMTLEGQPFYGNDQHDESPPRIRRQATSSVPHKLVVIQQPKEVASGLPFRKQPIVKLLNDKDEPTTGSRPDGKPWEVVATGSTTITTLQGTTTVPVGKDGLATFTDLRFGSAVTQIRLNFHVYTGDKNITTSSEPFNIDQNPYMLDVSSVNIRYINHDKQQNRLTTEITVRDLYTKNLTDLQGEDWEYDVTLRYTHPNYKVKLNGPTSGTFNTTSFKFNNILTGWVYQQQLLIKVKPKGQLAMEKYTDRFNSLRPRTMETKYRSKPYVLSVRINATAEEAQLVDHYVAEWSFLNRFAIKNGSQLWENCRLHATDEPKMEWQISGKVRSVNLTATAMHNATMKQTTFSFEDSSTKAMHTWALVPQTIIFKGQAYSPPPELPFTIFGILYSHVLLGVVIAIMILPVFYLCCTWKRHERLIQERYQERIQQYAQPPPKDNKSKKTKKASTEEPAVPTEADRSNNGPVAPPFYIDTAPPPAEMLPGHVFNPQDEWKLNAASAPLYPSFNPTGDGLPPPRFRWSAPEKTGMMELTMSQLKQQHRDFMEQTAGGGGNLSFSRYRWVPPGLLAPSPPFTNNYSNSEHT